jgi:hypothetical protein
MNPEKKPSIALGVFGGLALFFIGLPVAIILLFLIAMVPAILGFAVVIFVTYKCLQHRREIAKESWRVGKAIWDFIFGSKFETLECRCGQRIEYPAYARGAEINCPVCQQILFCRPLGFNFRKAFHSRSSKIYAIIGALAVCWLFSMFPIFVSFLIGGVLIILTRRFNRDGNL